MSDKYPGVSPYAYCANNPVVLKDPNGEDYEVVVDEGKKTITIRAVYYTTKDKEDMLQKGINEWKKLSFSYVVGKGKEKEKYSIKFDLSIKSDFDNSDDASTAFNEDQSGIANYFQVAGIKERGETWNGNNITIRNDMAKESDAASIRHEIGHTLGIGEWSSGLMESAGNGTRVGRRNIQQLMNRAGISHPPASSSLYNNPMETRWEHVGKGLNKSDFHKDGTVW